MRRRPTQRCARAADHRRPSRRAAILAADRYTIADTATYAYAHVANEAGIDTTDYGHFRAWLQRVSEQPGFVDDLAPYPANASVLAGRSIYG
jgi:glutathione S-transferase